MASKDEGGWETLRKKNIKNAKPGNHFPHLIIIIVTESVFFFSIKWIAWILTIRNCYIN